MWLKFFYLLLSCFSHAESLITISGVYPVINTAADKTTEATFYRKHSTTSLIGATTIAIQWTKRVFGDIRYEYWISDRKYDLNGKTFNHRLNYQTVGLDFGYAYSHPRVWWALVGGAHYPITASSSGFSGTKRFQFQTRAMLGIRTSKRIWLMLETGWRWADLGALSDGSTSYVESNGTFDLSGALVSLGFAVQL